MADEDAGQPEDAGWGVTEQPSPVRPTVPEREQRERLLWRRLINRTIRHGRAERREQD